MGLGVSFFIGQISVCLKKNIGQISVLWQKEG